MSLVAAHAAARSADLVAAPDMPEGDEVEDLQATVRAWLPARYRAPAA